MTSGTRVVLIYNIGPQQGKQGDRSTGANVSRVATARQGIALGSGVIGGAQKAVLEGALARRANLVLLVRMLTDFRVSWAHSHALRAT